MEKRDGNLSTPWSTLPLCRRRSRAVSRILPQKACIHSPEQESMWGRVVLLSLHRVVWRVLLQDVVCAVGHVPAGVGVLCTVVA